MDKWTLTNEQYDILKWIVSVVIPALIVFLGTTMNALEWSHTETFLLIAGGLELFLGTIFKWSDINYEKNKEE